MTALGDYETCPCGNGSAYANCCKPLHVAGHAGLGTTAEATMRSRYTAYVIEDAAYLLASWHNSTRPASIDFSEDIEWHGLTVINIAGGAGLDTSGTVEFTARFRRGEAHLELHELSNFVRENGRWFYVDGIDPVSE